MVTEWLSVQRLGLKVGSSIPTVARGYLIFPAQKDENHERHQGAHP